MAIETNAEVVEDKKFLSLHIYDELSSDDLKMMKRKLRAFNSYISENEIEDQSEIWASKKIA